MGASHSRNVRESRSGAPDRRAPRRTREESESSTNQDTPEPYLRRRRLEFSRSLGLPRGDTEVDGSLRAARVFPRNLRRHWGRVSPQESSQLAFAPPSTDINIAQQHAESSQMSSSPLSEMRESGSAPSSAINATPLDFQSWQSQPAANVEEQNAQPTPSARLDEPLFDPRPAPSLFSSSVSPNESSLPLSSHPRLNPHSLRGTASPDESRANRAQRAEALPGTRGAPPSSAFGTLLSEVLGASREAHSGSSSNMPVSGTSVIVQGALVARTAPNTSSPSTDAQRPAAPAAAPASMPSAESASQPEAPHANSSLDPNAFPSSNTMPGTPFGSSHSGDQPGSVPGSEVPHVATLEEQGEMLGRILRIATAATAASLVSPGSSASGRPPNAAAGSNPANANETNADADADARQSSNSTRPQELSTASTATSSGPNTGSSIGSTTTSSATESSESQATRPDTSRSASGRLGSELLERLASLSSRGNTDESSQQRRDSAPESGAMSTISRLMRDALRTSSPPPPRPNSDQAHERGPVVSNVLSILDRARQGDPLTEGEPESFERFLHDLILDLSAAVMELDRSHAQTTSDSASDPSRAQATNSASSSSARASGWADLPSVGHAGDHGPSSENNADHPVSTQTGDASDYPHTDSASRPNDLDPRVLARREGDLSWGQLSFFRLFRFERNAQSLIPCVLVGVRSLRPDERLMGTDERTEEGLAGTSRFVLFVSGGRYHDQHPLLTARPRDAGRDLMFMMELLGTMVAMSSKPQTASASEIARSGLPLIKAEQLPKLHSEGKVTENTSEKCLVCLEDWQPTDECRILNCHHAFHSGCVDQWLEKSSNSCPLCTY
ncbi:hypothetical protein MYAM1_001688 [Malassezia yamatoensis]|uniref:RING-type domain-containing protein n=1 Tax=Malassezia yamatoensis TaxID=253288 RepID=A0AAJ5YRT0_9BASI|nr:hypothetical protein MYAM1_001688 [Malassezia yamatoensis]